MISPSRRLAAAFLALALTSACSSSAGDSASPTVAGSTESSSEAPSIRVISAAEGAATLENPPEDLVILDVRTPDEFAETHIEGALLIDFYDADFANQIAELDPDVPYLVYCRSGNRSGQAVALMEELGFRDVIDIDGGILSWSQANLPTVSE